MVKPNDFESGKLNVLGATRLAREIEEKQNVEAKVVSNGENEVYVFGKKVKHRFVAESDKFHYFKENGKVKDLFKKFESLRKEFWEQEAKRGKWSSERDAERKLKEICDGIYKTWKAKPKIERGKGMTKRKRKVKKMGRIARQRKSATRKNQKKLQK